MSALTGSRHAAALGRRYSWLQGQGRRYFLLIYGLVVLGLVAVFSASYPLAGRPTLQGGNPYSYFEKQMVFALVGLGLMLILARLRVRTVAGLLAAVGLPVSLVLMVVTLVWGVRVNGATAWMEIPCPLLGVVRFQPSELAKVCLVAFLAVMLARGPITAANWGKIVLPAAGATVVMVLLLLAQSDVGMAMLVLATALGLALLAGVRGRYVLGSVLGVLALGVVLVRSNPRSYVWERLMVWLHPEEHLRGGGYHAYNMLIALARGGLVGAGLGMSPDKWRNLPVPHTDSIFCVLGGELGWWGAAGVIALMALLALWAFGVARRCPHRLGWFLAAGMGLTLALQGFLNIAVATALLPITGLTLPFISAGGSSIISCLLATGVVLSVAAECPPGEESR